ncbi:hypothetical protein NEFER03_1757 [Nematocida sp. LUAm3]|nr:hypothetical protein NEFER03_1757 [Nematocida sp. LUAm3]KAI5173936.1 hypothetical protein NEFER02_0403 [Nematocida sp. LUAm2]KAI5177319.1 hypothetical protein NEFER01_0594 [Nematocida sp. LUAm1]
MHLLKNKQLFIAITLIFVFICTIGNINAEGPKAGAANPATARGPGPAKSGGGSPVVVGSVAPGDKPSLLWRILLYQGGGNGNSTFYNAFHGPLCLTILGLLFIGMISGGCAGVGKAGGAV